MNSLRLAEAVRAALREAANAAYEDAGVQGLCPEGRWEAAVSAMETLDLQDVLRNAGTDAGQGGD